ncbi:MAG TPA: protein phosphatase CheZ [Stellaceae bacterium]
MGRKLDAIGSRTRIAVDTTEVAAVVEAIVESLSGDMSIADLKLYAELEQLAQYIQRAKKELAEIQPHDIRERHIPMATDELDAVVEATADATGAILDEAETIQKLAAVVPPEKGAPIGAAVTRIYEACNFQDITGQRITKVVKTLKYIEGKIDALLAAFDESVGGKKAAAAQRPPDEDFVSGPQLPSNANNQDEIDAILASLDGK